VELEAGRAAFARREWASTHAALSGRKLDADDLELLATAAFLLGRDDESSAALEAAHRAWMNGGHVDRAARCAAWLSLTHLLRGEQAVGSGWLARTERMLADHGPCSAAGLILVASVLGVLEEDPTTAAAMAADMLAIGRRFADADVVAFGLLCSGEAAIAVGDAAVGVRLFDEVMVTLGTDDVSPVTTGIVYCAVIEACIRVFDLRRAAEWTEALRRWCVSQPDLVPYRGQCLVHRSQVMQARGEWDEAEVEVERAQRFLANPAHPALGIATYQRGELHRVRGELDDAERAYREAGTLGCEPVPGLALLRLAQGRLGDAAAGVGRVLDTSGPAIRDPALLAAAVDVYVATGDLERARWARDQLSRLAVELAAPMLGAAAGRADGTVRLAEGDAAGALAALGEARQRALELDLRYDAARIRTTIAMACRALGDRDHADFELDAAIAIFDELGAHVDVARARSLRRTAPEQSGGLSKRECEVLRLVASGETNREIAADLHISEHTVARHLQNMFTKLGLSSRAAATAYAYEHGLIGGS
jgi:ATP/maltotriose-dependent transcriptional regulator MalT